jgi:hypothetical protein
MQKIKYIIIFTLILALAIIYTQLSNYQTITSSLLRDNTNNNINTKELQNKIILLETQNQLLTDEIISLEETILQIKIESSPFNFTKDGNTTIILPNTIQSFEYKEIQESKDIDMKPNITIDDENKITGFELEYKQKF